MYTIQVVSTTHHYFKAMSMGQLLGAGKASAHSKDSGECEELPAAGVYLPGLSAASDLPQQIHIVTIHSLLYSILLHEKYQNIFILFIVDGHLYCFHFGNRTE